MPTESTGSESVSADLVRVTPASSVPETLPGLDDSLDANRVSNLERAVIATLDSYRESGLITPAQAGKVALAQELCRVMTSKRERGRTSTYANDARLLNEILDGFVAEEGAGNEALRAAMEAWSARVDAYAAGVAAGQAMSAAS
jgi:hypothetical protein